MKRHEGLLVLTHDHHHGLAQARRLKIAADTADESARRRSARDFIDFFRSETITHFREEEEKVFPLLLEHVDSPPELLSDLLVEHVKIHGLVSHLQRQLDSGSVSPELLRVLGQTLEGHIRAEERKLFEIIEKAVPDEDLQTLSFASRARRTTS